MYYNLKAFTSDQLETDGLVKILHPCSPPPKSLGAGGQGYGQP
jgi:hypothetical protein